MLRLKDKTVPLPNLFVAGAQKSGTTSLHRYLENHPEVFFPDATQEIHFFDLDANYKKGVNWYEKLFSEWAGQRYVAQTSPLYLYEPAVAGRIAELTPGARFVFILRNPIDRAYSHYWHEVRYGWESLPFDQAIAQEQARLKGGFENRRHYSYIDRGMYAEQLKRFLDVFPRENIHVEITERFSIDVNATARRIAEFLDLDKKAFEQLDGCVARNQRKIPRWPIVQRWVRDWHDRRPRLYGWIERINMRSVPYPPMDPEIRKHLRDRLLPEVRALQGLLEIDVSCWSDFA